MAKIFFPQYRKGKNGIEMSKGKTIFDYVQQADIEIASECADLGKCGQCIVRIEKGMQCLNEKTEQEKKHPLGEDERLSCQAKIVNTDTDLYIFIKDIGKFSILTETVQTKIQLDPFVKRKGDKVIHCSGKDLGKYMGEIFGLAIDVGTTTLVMQLIDLEDGRIIDTVSRKNPQISYGNDVISRIDYTMRNKDGLEKIQKCIIGAVNDSLEQMEKKIGEIRKYIYDIVAVGNPTMRNLFFGLPVDTLGVIPFEPPHPEAICKKAIDIGLIVNPKCNVYGPPLIGGHVGADTLADILACGMYNSKNVVMVIDIGTNGEVVIGNKDRMLCASCAAGGAYEGASTKYGVGAVEGAISNIWINNGKISFETIGGKPPIGICGSGLIDLLAEMLRNGIMDKKAKIKKEFFVTEKISINQQDIYQLITAKAGLRTDQDFLIKYYGTTLDKVERIFLSGGFGNFINPANASAIGLLPSVPEKIVKIGNGALTGARELLLSIEMATKVRKIISKIEHIKPNEKEPDFAYLVAEKMYF